MSKVKPLLNSTPTLRKSQRLLLKSHPPPLDPKTPEASLRACCFSSDHFSLSSEVKGSVKKFPKKIEESKCKLNSLRKLNNGLNRSGAEKSDFCVRRSPRLSNKVKGFNESLEEDIFNRKTEISLSRLGKMKVRSDLRKQAVAKSGIKKRVTRSWIQEDVDEVLKNGNVYKKGLQDVSVKQAEGKKRVTRGSVLGTSNGTSMKISTCKNSLSNSENTCLIYDSKQVEGKSSIEKRVTRSSVRRYTKEITKKKCDSKQVELDVERSFLGDHSEGKCGFHTDEGSPMVEKTKAGANFYVDLGGNMGGKLSRSCGVPLVVTGKMDVKKRDFDKGKKPVGFKRKRNQDEGNHGWTQDQELTLQRAYFAAKPTPNFWKRVAKLVPGKSAHDCFNKVHADHLTPPKPRTRLRTTNRDVSSFSLSASKILKPEISKIGKMTSRKQSGHLAQKSVRQLLQKHINVDQGHEVDSFSVLESTFNPSTDSLECGVSYSTPQSEKGRSGLFISHDKSSSSFKKQLSRLSSSSGACLVSPPVLKPVKNKVLHEKYIDQLHCREAKRRLACAKENTKKGLNQKTETIKVLKDALVLDAKDFIHKFQHRKDDETKEYVSDDGNEGFEEYDEEDEL